LAAVAVAIATGVLAILIELTDGGGNTRAALPVLNHGERATDGIMARINLPI
jgi:hypothetical protein